MLYTREQLDRHPFGAPLPLAEDLYLVRVPLPNNSLAALNSYFILDDGPRGEQTTIVDVGFDHPACVEALGAALQALGRGWEGVRVVLTHSHPDHTGALGRIEPAPREVLANFDSFDQVKGILPAYRDFYTPFLNAAATPAQRAELAARLAKRETAAALPRELAPQQTSVPIAHLGDGDTLHCGRYHFEVLATPGHDPWHICLHEPHARIMIVGDHVLSRITPSVQALRADHDALGDFLRSQGLMCSYDVDAVLTGHEALYADLPGRAQDIVAHHEQRLTELTGLVEAGHDDLVALSSHAKWRYDDWMGWDLGRKLSSMGETMAHVIYLERIGVLRMEGEGSRLRFRLV